MLGGALLLPLTLAAQTFTILYDFGSQHNHEAAPHAGVIPGPQGELYGTASKGGKWNLGTVFELLPPPTAGGDWTETVLHSFNGQDGESPTAGLARGPSGALYGVTPSSANGSAMAFQLDPPDGTNTHWTYSIIYQFTNSDGIPSGALVFGTGQSLYGVTETQSGGTVYSLTPPAAAGGTWTQTSLYNFADRAPGGNLKAHWRWAATVLCSA